MAAAQDVERLLVSQEIRGIRSHELASSSSSRPVMWGSWWEDFSRVNAQVFSRINNHAASHMKHKGGDNS